MSDDRRQLGGDRENRTEINAGLISHALEHVHQILCADIARCTRRKRTSSQAAKRSIEAIDAHFQGREHVRKPHAAGVVKVRRDLQAGPIIYRPREEMLNLSGVGYARCVTQCDPIDPKAFQSID